MIKNTVKIVAVSIIILLSILFLIIRKSNQTQREIEGSGLNHPSQQSTNHSVKMHNNEIGVVNQTLDIQGNENNVAKDKKDEVKTGILVGRVIFPEGSSDDLFYFVGIVSLGDKERGGYYKKGEEFRLNLKIGEKYVVVFPLYKYKPLDNERVPPNTYDLSEFTVGSERITIEPDRETYVNISLETGKKVKGNVTINRELEKLEMTEKIRIETKEDINMLFYGSFSEGTDELIKNYIRFMNGWMVGKNGMGLSTPDYMREMSIDNDGKIHRTITYNHKYAKKGELPFYFEGLRNGAVDIEVWYENYEIRPKLLAERRVLAGDENIEITIYPSTDKDE